MKKELVIIGCGRFGRLAAEQLRQDFSVLVVEHRKTIPLPRQVRRITLQEAGTKKLIILAVQIRTMPHVLKALAPIVRPGTLVCDVCSVKEQPMRWMRDILPRHCQVLGTHPLFGPDSTRRSLNRKNIVLCPGRISDAKVRRITSYLRSRGLLVRTTTARRHDETMASTLFLTQFVGHTLHRLPLSATQMTTMNYEMLRHIASTTSRDTIELFQDMYRFNRFARTIPSKIIRKFTSTISLLQRSR